MQTGKCRLCLKTKELCDKSHIIPRFLYKIIQGENNGLVFVTKERARIRYNGEWEAGLLCEDCDNNVIGKLDDYVAKFIHNEFHRKIISRLEVRDGIEFLVIEKDPNYDYTKYKLFLLSVLWRSSISSRPFFGQVKFSEGVEEDLREMILNGNPREPEKYAPLLFLPPLLPAYDGDRGFDTFYMQTMSPIAKENDDMHIYRFLIEGMTIFFVIPKKTRCKNRALCRDG